MNTFIEHNIRKAICINSQTINLKNQPKFFLMTNYNAIYYNTVNKNSLYYKPKHSNEYRKLTDNAIMSIAESPWKPSSSLNTDSVEQEQPN